MIVSAEVVALVAAAVAVFAAVLAVRATALTARTVLASQEALPRPPVSITVSEAHTRRNLSSDTRDYAFVVSATNRAASDWRCDEPALRVTYRTRANFLGAVDLVATDPLALTAGQTVTATLRFTTSNVIPRHCRVDAYTLLFTDRDGNRVVLDASVPAVLQADSDATGPATWGWD
jgi:hypothetical protein